jgi:hypothetical protein
MARKGGIMCNKSLEEMDFSQRHAYWKGYFLIELGKGEYGAALWLIMDQEHRIAKAQGYQEGYEQAKKDARSRRTKKAKKK